MKEQWREILDGNYEVSNAGRVRRAKPGRRTFAGRLMSPIKMKNGYFYVGPTVNGRNVHFYVHDLVAAVWLGPKPAGLSINHIDGDKLNNVVGNLEYVTRAGNMRHAADAGLMARGERHARSLLTDDAVREIRAMRARGIGLPEICAKFNIARSTASQAATGKRWGHVQ